MVLQTVFSWKCVPTMMVTPGLMNLVKSVTMAAVQRVGIL